MKIRTNEQPPQGKTKIQPIEWFEEPPFAVDIRQRRLPLKRAVQERTQYVNVDIYLLNHRPAGSPAGVRRNRWDRGLDRQGAIRTFSDPVSGLADPWA
jgi:hypothetical protein